MGVWRKSASSVFRHTFIFIPFRKSSEAWKFPQTHEKRLDKKDPWLSWSTNESEGLARASLVTRSVRRQRWYILDQNFRTAIALLDRGYIISKAPYMRRSWPHSKTSFEKIERATRRTTAWPRYVRIAKTKYHSDDFVLGSTVFQENQKPKSAISIVERPRNELSSTVRIPCCFVHS